MSTLSLCASGNSKIVHYGIENVVLTLKMGSKSIMPLEKRHLLGSNGATTEFDLCATIMISSDY